MKRDFSETSPLLQRRETKKLKGIIQVLWRLRERKFPVVLAVPQLWSLQAVKLNTVVDDLSELNFDQRTSSEVQVWCIIFILILWYLQWS